MMPGVLTVIALFLALAAVTLVAAAPAADEVTALPDFAGPLPSRHYSGYINALPGSYLHYYWVTAQVADPSTAPIIWWTNGGPGCSSMEGWGYELGPLQFKRYNTSGPTITVNPWTWAKLAHLVFVENPPGVGFSYRDDDNYTINDTMNAQSNVAALVDLLTSKFPEYRNNSLYLSGESYAGIYVPMLAQQILSRGPAWMPQFRGILVGNGVTDNTYDSNFGYSTGEFAAGHGLMSPAAATAMTAACIPDGNTPTCTDVSYDFYRWFTVIDFYGYTLPCFNPLGNLPINDAATDDTGGDDDDDDDGDSGSDGGRRRTRFTEQQQKLRPRARRSDWKSFVAARAARAAIGGRRRLLQAPPTTTQDPDLIGSVDCTDAMELTRYLNRPDVKQALHVRTPRNNTARFGLCADIRYTSNVNSVVQVYNALIAAGKTVLIFNGNVDMVVPYTGTWNWIKYSTNWAVTRDFAAWSYPVSGLYPSYGPQVGGFAMQYANSVWFVLVNGAGHMVPEDQPAAAFEMVSRVLSGTGFPESPVVANATLPTTTATSTAAPATTTQPAAAPEVHPATAWTAVSFFIGLICGVVLLALGLFIRSKVAAPSTRGAELQEPMVETKATRSVQAID